MCVFCAAIPATLAVGTALEGQRRAEPAPGERARRSTRSRLPVGKLTIVAVSALAVASVTYHTHLFV